MMYLYIASCLFFAGTVYGQCATIENCVLTYLMTSTQHGSNTELLCGDLSTLEKCILASNCSTTEKDAQINQTRKELQARGVNCGTVTTKFPLSTTAPVPACKNPLESCVKTYGAMSTQHASNADLVCGDLSALEKCLLDSTCPDSVDLRDDVITQTKNQLQGKGVTCGATTSKSSVITVSVKADTTKLLTTPTPKPNACTNTIDQCIITFAMLSTQRGPNADLVCGDLAVMERCVIDSNCGDSNAEKEELIAQTKSQLTSRGIKCDTTTTKAPLTTTSSALACTNPLDQCVINFAMISTQRGPNAFLVCGDLAVMEKCVNDSNCGNSNAEKEELIAQTKSQLTSRGIICGTTTTKAPSTTTSSDKACTNPLDQCVINFAMISTQRGPNADLVCGDLAVMEKCVIASNCGNSNAEKEELIVQTKSQLTSRGIKCGTTTTKAPPTTSSTVTACTNPLDECVINFAMISTQRGPNADLVCGDLAVMEKCVIDSNCGNSNAEKEELIAQTKSQLTSRGIKCGTTTTKAPPTTTSSAKACTTALDQCVINFAMISTQRGPNADLVCGDLAVMEKCITDSNCGNSYAEKEELIVQTKSQLTSKGIKCGTTTTKAPSTTTSSVKACTNPLDQCVINFAMISTQRGPNADLVCGDLAVLEKCANDSNCGTSNAEKEELIAQTKSQLTSRGIKCAATTTKAPSTTTSSVKACTTTLEQCVVNFVIISTQRGPNADLLCGDLAVMEKCVIDSSCGNSNAEKEDIIAQTKSQLTSRGINCDRIVSTTVSPVTTTKIACKTLVDNCVYSFVVASAPHTTDAYLTCRDFSTMEKCIAAVCDSPDAEKSAAKNQIKTQLQQKYNISCVYGATYPTTKSPVTSTMTVKSITSTKTNDFECREMVDKCVLDFLVFSTSHGQNPALICGDFHNMETCIMETNCGLPDKEKRLVIDQIANDLAAKGVMCGTTTRIPVKTTEESCFPEKCMDTFIQSISDHNGIQELICGDLRNLDNCLAKINCGTSEMQKTAFIDQSKQLIEFQGIKCDCNSKVRKCQNIFIESYSASGANQDLVCSYQRTFEKCIQEIDCLSANNKTLLTEINKQDLEKKGTACDCVNGFSQCQESYQNAAFNKPITKTLLCNHIQTFMKCIFDLSTCDLSDAYKDNLLKQTKDELDARKVPCDIYKVLYGNNDSEDNGHNSGNNLILQTIVYLFAVFIGVLFML